MEDFSARASVEMKKTPLVSLFHVDRSGDIF